MDHLLIRASQMVLALCLESCPALVSDEIMNKQRIDDLIEAFANPDRSFPASQELERHGRENEVVRQRLIEALRDKRRLVRLAAAQTLGGIGPKAPDAIPELERMLKNPNEENGERLAAANALGLIGKASMSVFKAGLRDADPIVRRFAADMAGRLRESTELVPMLIDALGDDDERVRRGAISSLEDAFGRAAAPELEKALKHKSGLVRVSAGDVLLLLRLKRDRVVPILVEELEHEDRAVRKQAAWALRHAGPEANKAVPGLAKALKDKDGEVREGAAYTLAEFGPAAHEAIPALTSALSDSRAEVRARAVLALGRIGPKAHVAVPDLVARLRDRSLDVANEVVQALGAIGPQAKDALPALEAIAADRDHPLSESAAVAIGRILRKNSK